jgi:K+-transporting ATPase ATPase C chain
MVKYLSKSVFLLFVLVIIICVFYPLLIWIIGQVFFPFQANGSIILGSDGTAIGSKLIAQPFTKEELFHSRPSAAFYDASASASSSLAPSNYLLRNRIATILGPIVTYTNGQAVGPDIETWFQQDRYQNNPYIVAQWAMLHPSLAQAWINKTPEHQAYVEQWLKTHPDLMKQVQNDNLAYALAITPELSVAFFQNFSKENPGKFPSVLSHFDENKKMQLTIEPINSGRDIQSIFFDMWRQDNPNATLQELPADFVTTSASGLDPHISLKNAEYQLTRVSTKWAALIHRNPNELKNEINQLLKKNAHSPLGGLAGEPFVNVLDINILLYERYGVSSY